VHTQEVSHGADNQDQLARLNTYIKRAVQCAHTAGAGDPDRSEIPVSKITKLAAGHLTATETITVELVEADETPPVERVRLAVKPKSRWR
jgi:hypothetical protein